MTTHTFDLADLEIIGFASTLGTPTLPRVLAPVFCVRGDPDRILLPPFSIQSGEVWRAHESNRAEFDEFIAKEKITALDPPIPAKADHDLWVSPEGNVAYEPKTNVKRAFKTLYAEHLRQAESKLTTQDYETACRHAAVARAVDPGKLDPLIIRAVAERTLGQDSRYEFTRHIAEDIVKPAEFDQLVQERVRGAGMSSTAPVQPAKTAAAPYKRAKSIGKNTPCDRGAHSMCGVSKIKSRFPSPTAIAA